MRHLITALAVVQATAAPAAELGDDGRHKAPWMVDTFEDLGKDLGAANAEGRCLMVIVEQHGCICCARIHEEVFVEGDIAAILSDGHPGVQHDMFGDVEGTDFDGAVREGRDLQTGPELQAHASVSPRGGIGRCRRRGGRGRHGPGRVRR